MNIYSYYSSRMPRVKSSYHIKLYKLWFFFQGEAVVQFLSIRSHFCGYLTIVGWVKCIWFLCVQLLFSLRQKPHSLSAVHGCGHVIANLSPCCCKLTSKPENGVQWVVSANSSYASRLVNLTVSKSNHLKVFTRLILNGVNNNKLYYKHAPSLLLSSDIAWWGWNLQNTLSFSFHIATPRFFIAFLFIESYFCPHWK